LVLVSVEPDGYVLSDEEKARLRAAYPDVEIEIRVLIPAELHNTDVPTLYSYRQVVPRRTVTLDLEALPAEMHRMMRMLELALCFTVK
jgi:hypothetical protein